MASSKWDNYQASKLEHRGYGAFFFGQNLVWGLAGLVATFATDIGLGAALVGVILLAPKVWDAVNDTLFGYILDRSQPKSGQKFLPWMKLGTLLLGFATVLMFAAPASLSDGIKVGWIIVAYIIFDTAYTMLDAPLFALPSALTTNLQERDNIVANGRLFALLGGLMSQLLIPMIRPRIGWLLTAIVIVALSLILMLPLALKGKERQRAADENETGIRFGEMLRYLASNGQLFVTLLGMFIIGLTSVEMVLTLYTARICFGDESLSTILMGVIILPVLILAKIIPTIIKKVDKFKLFIGGLLISLAGGIVMYFIDYTNFPLVVGLSFFKSVGLVSYNVIAYMFVIDSVEYGTYKTGTRASGISFSLQTFTAKLRGALLTTFAMTMLGLTGFVSGEHAVQPLGVAENLWRIYTLIPVGGYILAIGIFLLFYKLRDKTVLTMSRYNVGEISKQEADALLADKYGPAHEKHA